MVMAFGCSRWNGVSGCEVVTPEAIGYSKLIEWAMISWPCFEIKEGQELLRRSLMGARREHRRRRDVEHVAGVAGGEVSDVGVHVRRADLGPQSVPVVLVDHTEGHRAPIDLVGDGLVVGIDLASGVGLDPVEPLECLGLP